MLPSSPGICIDSPKLRFGTAYQLVRSLSESFASPSIDGSDGVVRYFLLEEFRDLLADNLLAAGLPSLSAEDPRPFLLHNSGSFLLQCT